MFIPVTSPGLYGIVCIQSRDAQPSRGREVCYHERLVCLSLMPRRDWISGAQILCSSEIDSVVASQPRRVLKESPANISLSAWSLCSPKDCLTIYVSGHLREDTSVATRNLLSSPIALKTSQ